MSNFGIRLKLFIICGAAAVLFLIPIKCFAQPAISQAESKVYREKLITEAKKYVGVPYQRGAVGPDSFDCSGFVFYVARTSIQYQLPRTTKAIYSYVKIIADSQREPGDLVFFKTTSDGSISHVGIYIGNGQFISAVSDGPNTGIIVSSLRENYWKTHYAASGKFLRDADWDDSEDDIEQQNKSSGKIDNAKSFDRPVSERLWLDGAFTADWALFTKKRFMPNFRGLTTYSNIIYKGNVLSPGAGIMLRWNNGVKAFQIPVVFSLSFGDYVRTYAGPVFTTGMCIEPDSDEEIRASVFPGIIGVTFNTPSVTKQTVKVQFIQDINYTVFNNLDNSALSPLRSFAAGLEFSTGVRVMFPLSLFRREA